MSNGKTMNTLQSAWKKVRHHAIEGVAVVWNMRSAYLAEVGRCRAIAGLEALPRSVLRDIGIRRVDIPVVVAKSMQEQRERAAGEAEGQSARSSTPLEESANSVSPSPVA